MNKYYLKAIKNICPNSSFSVEDTYESIVWFDQNIKKPTKKQVEIEVTKLIKEYEALEYQRLRQNEYPSLEEQLDKLYHDGFESWKNQIKTIKDKYPKPEVV